MPYLPLTGQTTTSSSSPRYYNQSYAPENGLNKTGSSSQYNHSYPSAPEVPQGDQSIPPPQASSNTYQTSQSGNNSNWSLPSGWKVAYRNNDDRMYYFELATGKTTRTWNHPSAPSFPAQDGGNVEQETPMTAFKRPDSHQCCAVLSFFGISPPWNFRSCAFNHDISLLEPRELWERS